MEFLADSQCCTKCLQQGLHNPFVAHKVRPKWRVRWCRTCWNTYIRAARQRTTEVQQKHLRAAEWKARALMSPDERRRTPLVHIPPTTFTGKNKGMWRIALVYQAWYGKYRKQVERELRGEPQPITHRGPKPTMMPLKTRHVVLPTS